MSRFEGGCLCGAVRYVADGPVLGSAACHCRDCQYVSGGAPAYVFVVPRSSLKITRGQTKVYWSEADSGAQSGNPDIRYHLAYALQASGQDDPARTILRELVAVEAPFSERQAAEQLLARLAPS